MNLRTGRINHDVYDRSVVKRLGPVYTRPVMKRPVYEAGAAAVIATDTPENARGATVTANAVVTGPYRDCGSLALYKACNALAEQAVMPQQVSQTILLPEGSDEQTLRDLEDDLAATAGALQLHVIDGEVEVTAAVTRPVVSIQATGTRLCALDVGLVVPGMQMYIVASKWTGLAGTWLLARERDDDLQRVFAAPLLETACAMRTLTSVVPEARAMIAGRIPYVSIVSCGTGGIYAALWKITQQLGRGFAVSLPDIPIRQETIEICNYYDINPYRMEAAGCLLCVTPEPQALIRVWNDAGIHAAVIGTIADDHDMRIVNGEETAHLNKPQGDALDEYFHPFIPERWPESRGTGIQ